MFHYKKNTLKFLKNIARGEIKVAEFFDIRLFEKIVIEGEIP